MNFIQKIVEKYGGDYSEELTKRFNWFGQKITYQPKFGVIKVGGTLISINLKEAGGAMRTTDPIRIVLFLDKDYGTKLSVYPSINLNIITDLIFQPKSLKVPKLIKKQFSFRGDFSLIKKLLANKLFYESISNEDIYLTLDKTFPQSLMLTPAYGIYSMEHFDKLITILKQIEATIKSKST